jgi:hypothetical protein
MNKEKLKKHTYDHGSRWLHGSDRLILLHPPALLVGTGAGRRAGQLLGLFWRRKGLRGVAGGARPLGQLRDGDQHGALGTTQGGGMQTGARPNSRTHHLAPKMSDRGWSCEWQTNQGPGAAARGTHRLAAAASDSSTARTN